MTQDIVITGLSKSFGEKQVLKDFSLSFPVGKTSVLMGPSGCGKTTLLRLIAGLETPDAGSILGVPERISFVFQEDRLAERLSAYRNLRLVLGKQVPKETVRQHLKELKLLEEEKKPVHTFSGGMKRRLAIARAMLYPSSLVILDEPFKGLDAALKAEVMDYVKRHRDGRTLILVSHDREEAAFMEGELTEMKLPREEET